MQGWKHTEATKLSLAPWPLRPLYTEGSYRYHHHAVLTAIAEVAHANEHHEEGRRAHALLVHLARERLERLRPLLDSRLATEFDFNETIGTITQVNHGSWPVFTTVLDQFSPRQLAILGFKSHSCASQASRESSALPRTGSGSIKEIPARTQDAREKQRAYILRTTQP